MAKRYFVSTLPHFIGNRRHPAGTVLAFDADKCGGRQFINKGKSEKGEIVAIDKPSKWMTECDASGNPLPVAGAPAPAPKPAPVPVVPEKKRSFDKEI